MRFTKPFWAGIKDGSITIAFRGWKTPTVVPGRPYRTGGGRIEVLSVRPVDPPKVTKADAARAGYASPADVLSQVRTDEGRTMYRVEFRRLTEADPREELANTSDLDAEDINAITDRLARFDRAATAGPWTVDTLRLIQRYPARRAPDLAEMVSRETQPFKLDVRKLKNLGLTRSLRIGYELSPRGAAYLDQLDSD
ncbi:MAG: hypothetical protein AAGA65_08275 [Actinomycetota bacterium]